MIKFVVSFLFSFIFMANLTLPTLNYTFNLDIEKSLLIDFSEEEEEEKGSEKQKELEIFLIKNSSDEVCFEENTTNGFTAYFYKEIIKCNNVNFKK